MAGSLVILALLPPLSLGQFAMNRYKLVRFGTPDVLIRDFSLASDDKLKFIGQQAETKEFDKDGLRFRYPLDWTLTDKSDREKQYLFLTHEKASLFIAVLAGRDRIINLTQFIDTEKKITEPYIAALAESLGESGHPAKRAARCLDVAGHNKVLGAELIGLYRTEPTTAEVYPFTIGGRLMTIVYVRANREAAPGDIAWKTIRESLKVIGDDVSSGDEQSTDRVLSGGILNGKALSLPRPPYPAIARAAHAGGTVTVNIVVNEKGQVISAKAISDHRLLLDAAILAARNAKFTPTVLCGEPIKVTGSIIYNFVAQ